MTNQFWHSLSADSTSLRDVANVGGLGRHTFGPPTLWAAHPSDGAPACYLLLFAWCLLVACLLLACLVCFSSVSRVFLRCFLGVLGCSWPTLWNKPKLIIQNLPKSTFAEVEVASSSLHCAFLPVWPATRLFWPPERWGFAVESAAARVCPEAGARVSVIVRVQDMHLARPDALDNRCLEIVADGLLLYQGAQLVVGTTLVSVLKRDGVPRQRSATNDGAALIAARRRKERVYLEFTGKLGRTRHMVLGGGVGGRWSEQCHESHNPLAKAKERREPGHLRARARQVWRHRWASLLACSAARAVALSLLERRGGLGSDGDTPFTTEAISDHRHLPFPG